MATSNLKKKQVVVGDLPDDFLRFDGALSTASQQNASSQLELDEQAARTLHHELNPQVVTPAMTTGYYAGGGFVPANTRGRLSICLVQARLTKNYGFVKMDPYCRVRVGSTIFETPTDAGGGKNPHWKRTVYCYFPHGIDSIYLEIFDERAFSTDERIAWSKIVIPESVFNGDTIDDWYTLSGQQGDAKEGMINLVFTLYPITAPHVAYVPVSQPLQPIVLSGGGVPPTAIPYTHVQQVAQVATQQPPQPQTVLPESRPMYTEQDVKELQEMFTNMDMEAVSSVLHEKRGNKEAAVTALLAMNAEDEAQPPAAEPTPKADGAAGE